MKIPDHVARSMRDAHAVLRDEPASHVEAIAKRLGGVPLYGDLGGVGVGCRLPAVPLAGRVDPATPDKRVDCDAYEGKGEVAVNVGHGQGHHAFWCGACHALGWRNGGARN